MQTRRGRNKKSAIEMNSSIWREEIGTEIDSSIIWREEFATCIDDRRPSSIDDGRGSRMLISRPTNYELIPNKYHYHPSQLAWYRSRGKEGHIVVVVSTYVPEIEYCIKDTSKIASVEHCHLPSPTTLEILSTFFQFSRGANRATPS